jgi:hypothetical protein
MMAERQIGALVVAADGFLINQPISGVTCPTCPIGPRMWDKVGQGTRRAATFDCLISLISRGEFKRASYQTTVHSLSRRAQVGTRDCCAWRCVPTARAYRHLTSIGSRPPRCVPTTLARRGLGALHVGRSFTSNSHASIEAFQTNRRGVSSHAFWLACVPHPRSRPLGARFPVSRFRPADASVPRGPNQQSTCAVPQNHAVYTRRTAYRTLSQSR